MRVYGNTWLDPVPEGFEYPEGRWYTENAWGRQGTREGKTSAADPDYREYFRPMWRWTPALQNDFAARADWCDKSYEDVNHPPAVLLDHALDLEAKPGDIMKLSAQGTGDPDGETLDAQLFECLNQVNYNYPGPK